MFFLVSGISCTILYYEAKHKIEDKVNCLFRMNALSFADSILAINNIPTWNHSNSKRYSEKHDLIIKDEDGDVVVPKSLVQNYNYAEFNRRSSETLMIHSGLYDIVLADSIWNSKLKIAGLDVESVLCLECGDLREMFPENGMYVADVATVIKSCSHELDYKDFFTSDTVELGILKHASMFSKTYIPVSTILKETKLLGWGLWIAIFSVVCVWLFVKFGKPLRKSDNNAVCEPEPIDVRGTETTIARIKHIVYNFETKAMSNVETNEVVIFTNTLAKAVEILITAENHVVKKTDFCRMLWSLDEQGCGSKYYMLIGRLRKSLSKIDGVELITIKNSALQLVVETQETMCEQNDTLNAV